MGKLSRKKGTAAENRDLTMWEGLAGGDRVLSKRRQEAANIATGADYEVLGTNYRLLVQRKHAKTIGVPEAWRKLTAARTRSDQLRVLHAEYSPAKKIDATRFPAPGYLDFAMVARDDLRTLRADVARAHLLCDVVPGHFYEVATFHLARAWRRAWEAAVEKDGKTLLEPALEVKWGDLNEPLIVYGWRTFVADFSAAELRNLTDSTAGP